MGIKGIFKFFAHRLFEIFVIVVLILLLPNLPPYTSFSEPFRITPTKPFEGKLTLNDKLNDAEIWHKGDLIGPEAFEEYNGELYVSLYGGDIVKLTGNHITPIVKTGKPCKGHYEERICGRPLGLKFDKNGMLYVADAYYGIFRINVKTGEKTLVISTDKEINGKKPKLPNSIALASNGDIYWSDSSTEFLLEDGLFAILADPSGRLIHYDAKTKTNRVLIDKLHFPNGVALSENEEHVLVAETTRNRIHRYYISGPKKGSRDIFVDGLPGVVDNIQPDGKGGYLVALLIAIDKDHPFVPQAIGPFPLLRKLAGRVLGLTQLLFQVVNKAYPCEFAQKAVHFVGHFSSVPKVFTPSRVTVVRLDESGQIVDSIHSLDKKISHICEAFIYKDTLYLGSPFNDYIARVPLSKIGWQDLAASRVKRDVPIQQSITTQHPTTTTAPPTTTTARPTTTRTTRPTTTTTTTTTSPPTTTTTTPPTTTTARPTTTSTTRPPTTTTTPPPTTTTRPPTTTTTRPPTSTTRPSTTTTTKPPTTTTAKAPTTTTPPPTTTTSPPASKQAPPKQQAPPPNQQRKQQTTKPNQEVPPKRETPPPTQQKPPAAKSATDQSKSVPLKESPKKQNV